MKHIAPFQKNDIINLTITALSNEGSGIGRFEGMAVFVPHTAIGDKIKARILKVLKNYAFAKVEEFISLSADRIEQECSVFSKCGGCALRHINYGAELAYKRSKVIECLKRIGSVEVEVDDIVASDSRERYRNKAVFPISENLDFGFYAAGSHRVIPNNDCKLQPEIFSVICNCFKEWAKTFGIPVYNETTGDGCLRRLFLRIAEATGQIMIVPVLNCETSVGTDELVESLKSKIGDDFTLVLNYNSSRGNAVFGEHYETVYGVGYIEDTLLGIRFRLSPQSFYQVNRKQAEKLYSIAAQFAEPENKTVLDLYCGIGTIGLSMAHKANKIIGAEIVKKAIEDANINAQINNINNAEFICGDASSVADNLSAKRVKPDVVIIDPPRKGCDRTLIETVALKLSPERVVYVSCDPATLARDIAVFGELGFNAIKVVPVDMFPNTAHVETVCLLSRTKQ